MQVISNFVYTAFTAYNT